MYCGDICGGGLGTARKPKIQQNGQLQNENWKGSLTQKTREMYILDVPI